MKRITSILLSVCIILSLSTTALAAEIDSQNAETIEIQQEVEKMWQEFPNAESIRVVDGNIHIVLNSMSDLPSAMITTRTTNVTSSDGGSYRDFNVPWSYTWIPYSQVYMNKTVVDGMKLCMTEPTFAAWIADQIGQGLTTAAVSALALATFGVSVPAAVCGVIGSFLYWAGSNVDYWSLKNAQENSTTGKVNLIRGYTYDGYGSTMYIPWNDNNCPTYCGLDATWHEGVWDVNY